MIRKRYVPQQKTPAYPNGARTPNETFQSPLRNLVLIGNCVHLCMRDEPLAVLRRGAGAVNAVVDAVLLAVAVILMPQGSSPLLVYRRLLMDSLLLTARSSLTFTGPDSDDPASDRKSVV